MYTYSITDPKSPSEDQDQIRANRYIVQEVRKLDPNVILIKTTGTSMQGRLEPTSDYDYCVFTTSNTQSSQQASVPNQDGEMRRKNTELSRPLSVRCCCINEFFDSILKLDLGFNESRPLRYASYFHCAVWSNLYTNHEPLYITPRGQCLVEGSSLFINRETVELVIRNVDCIHQFLLDEYRHKRVGWDSLRNRKHERWNLAGLEMCLLALDGELSSIDPKDTPTLPTNFNEYLEAYDSLQLRLFKRDMAELSTMNKPAIRSLLSLINSD